MQRKLNVNEINRERLGLLALSLFISFALAQTTHVDAVLMNCTIVNQSWTNCVEVNSTCPVMNSSSLESLVLNMSTYFQNISSQCSLDHDSLTLCLSDLAFY